MQRFLVKLAYDGSGFHGWQKQPNDRTVQNELENALALIAKTEIITIGSSRTDTGVHALSQYSHFDFPVKMSANQLKAALTTKLPKDIKILQVFAVNSDFHSRFMAVGRSYRYFITNEITPFNRNHKSWFPRYPIHYNIIANTIPILLGEHDFEFFCLKNPDLETYISNISSISFYPLDDDFVFEIAADRFLHNMVRRIIGTLIKLSALAVNNKLIITPKNAADVSTPQLKVEFVFRQLLLKNHSYLHLVYTAPPHGLFLTEVYYPEQLLINNN